MNGLKTAFLLMLTLALTGCGLLFPPSPKGLTAQEERGWQTYTRRCAACHKIKGKGGGSASDLTHIGSRRDGEWLKKWLRDPKSIAPQVKMPPPNLSESQIDDLTAYLLTLK